VERLVALSHPGVEVGGPGGSSHGVQILDERVDRANVHLVPLRTVHVADTVVVEQGAEWQAAEPSGHQTVASVFGVRDGLMTSVVRYPDLTSALHAAELEELHERRPG
jgi:hypothetical protein